MWDEKTSSSVYVELTGYSVRTSIEDSRRETQEVFEGLSPGERDALAFDAWTAGLELISDRRRTSSAVGLQRVSNAAKPVRNPVRLSTIPPSSW